MSIITQLDTDQISGIPDFTGESGEGSKIGNAMSAYAMDLANIECGGFYSDDTSTAHSVISSLQDQADAFDSMISDVNTILDEALNLIRTDIIEKENTLSETILS